MFTTFPREIASPKRFVVYSLEEFLFYVNTYNGKKDLYTSIYSFRRVENGKLNYNSAVIDKIFFDFDGEDSYKGVKKFAKFLHDDGIKFAIHFSGGGFHIFIAVESDEVINDYRLAIKSCQEEILNTYNLKQYCDTHVLGDIARITRIPNTFNLRRGRYCIPLLYEDLDKSFTDIKWMARKQRKIRKYWSKGRALKLKNTVTKPEKIINIGDGIVIDDIEPCIRNILSKRNPSHDERFLLVLWLSNEMREGIPIHKVNLDELSEKIVRYVEKLNWSDWDENYTRYQVRNIINKKFNNVPSHEWRKVRGICPGDCIMKKIEKDIKEMIGK